MKISNEWSIGDAFHFALYHGKYGPFGQRATPWTWCGYPIQQNPLDAWLYQELIIRNRPAVIVATGVADGGQLAYFNAIRQIVPDMWDGTVVGIDIELSTSAKTLLGTGVVLVESNSVNPPVIDLIKKVINGRSTMVVLDSDHIKQHVQQELELYSPLVTPGQYLVVEDTNVNGNPVNPLYGPGPAEALEDFLPTEKGFLFEVDREIWQKNMFSYHTWLRRKV